jgi:hypothetical protein
MLNSGAVAVSASELATAAFAPNDMPVVTAAAFAAAAGVNPGMSHPEVNFAVSPAFKNTVCPALDTDTCPTSAVTATNCLSRKLLTV